MAPDRNDTDLSNRATTIVTPCTYVSLQRGCRASLCLLRIGLPGFVTRGFVRQVRRSRLETAAAVRTSVGHPNMPIPADWGRIRRDVARASAPFFGKELPGFDDLMGGLERFRPVSVQRGGWLEKYGIKRGCRSGRLSPKWPRIGTSRPRHHGALL